MVLLLYELVIQSTENLNEKEKEKVFLQIVGKNAHVSCYIAHMTFIHQKLHLGFNVDTIRR